MRNFKIFIGLLLLAILTLSSCEENDWTYTGQSVAEFSPMSTSSTYTSAFSLTVKQANFVAGVDTVELKVNLVGPQQNKDINLGYTLVTTKVIDFPTATYFIDPTTAVEGTHFNFIPVRTGTANGVVTIPANKSTGIIKLNTFAAQVSPDVSKRVVIQLLPTTDLKVNPNYQYFIVTITRL
jgi:hypothetical protein